VHRGEPDLRSVRGVRRELLERIEAQSTAEPLASSSASPRRTASSSTCRAARRRKDRGGAHPVPCEAPGGGHQRIRKQEKKYIVCVSSQAGWRARLRLLRTGELGFQRNLQAAEIVGQVLAVRAEADRPVRGVVFMGMASLPQLRRGHPRCPHPCHPSGACIDARSITVSTAGIVPQIRRSPPRGTSSGWPCPSPTPWPASGCR